MKRIKFLFLGLMTLSLVLVGCKKDDDNAPKPVTVVEDGIYLLGSSVASADIAVESRMQPGVYEGEGFKATERKGMYQHVLFISQAGSFNIVEVKGSERITYGADIAVDPKTPWAFSGNVVQEGNAISVNDDGLYFVYLDLQADSKKIFVLKANDISIIGDGVGGTDISLTKKGAFSKTNGEWEATNVTFKKAWWKFRMNSNWTYTIAEGISAFTNLGGTPENLSPGGDNLPDLAAAKYTVNLKYEYGKGFKVTTTKTGESEAPVYPENLYMIGDDFGNWGWANDGVVEMIPVNGIEGAFWCINYFTAGNGFKWNSKKDWGGDFEKLGENSGFENNGGNAVVSADGLYSVYIDMAADRITIEPAKVFGKGDCFGGWPNDNNPVAPLPFTVNGTTMSATTTGAGELRMYAGFSNASDGWDWWKTEFIILNGKIVYRGTGDDQERVPVTAGKTVTLDFKAGTGKIE